MSKYCINNAMKYSFPNRWLSYTTFHIHNKIEYKNQERRICLFIILRQPLLKQKTTKGGQEAASVFSLFSIISLEASSIASAGKSLMVSPATFSTVSLMFSPANYTIIFKTVSPHLQNYFGEIYYLPLK